MCCFGFGGNWCLYLIVLKFLDLILDLYCFMFSFLLFVVCWKYLIYMYVIMYVVKKNIKIFMRFIIIWIKLIIKLFLNKLMFVGKYINVEFLCLLIFKEIFWFMLWYEFVMFNIREVIDVLSLFVIFFVVCVI